MKIAGVLGGFGPETTAEFYTSVIRKNRALNAESHPEILIHNAPVPFRLEEDAVRNAKNLEKFLPILLSGINAMHDKVDFIVLPCNTLHVFIEDLRKASKKPVVSIIDEVVSEIKSKNLKRVGLLATRKMFEEKLYENMLAENGIRVVNPDTPDIVRLSQIIHLILRGVKSEGLKAELFVMIGGLKLKGAEAVILGCTDLQLLLKQEDSPLRLIDTMDVLADSTVRLINKGEGFDGEG